MKALFLTLGPEIIASSRTRVYQYLPHLRRAGWNCRVLPHSSGIQLKLRQPTNKLLAWLVRQIWRLDALHRAWQSWRFERLASWADVLFIQKVLLPPDAQKRLRRLGKPVVFDFDDALYADLRNYDAIRFDHQLRQCDLAVLENEHTQEYAERIGCRTLRITGPIDADRYTPAARRPPDNHVTLGWIGSETTLPHLTHIAGALAHVGAQHPGVRLQVVGAGRVPDLGLPIVFVPWSLADEVEHLRSFDIGLMPLPDDEWTRGKGGYKLLQYMACGLPCVASPVGINTTLVTEGENGFLVRTDGEWIEKLTQLIDEPELRQTMGQVGRLRVEANYSFQAATPKLIEAVNQIMAAKRCYGRDR